MTTTSERIRAYTGPPLLSYGFRPFFLGGALWAAAAVALWLPVLSGRFTLPSAFAPLEWHVHELVYGYVPAVVAGFLLTAVPNWTGRLPVTGRPLLMLFLLWTLGRIAVFSSRLIGMELAAAIDLLFLATLAIVIAREILAAKNMHNLKVLGVIALLFAGNAAFHLEVLHGGKHGYGTRIGIAGAILLITLIGGRIIPSFTRNWLAKREAGRLPTPFNQFDLAAMLVSWLALAVWIAVPDHFATALLSLTAGLINAIRLGRWAGDRTVVEPLVLILHVAVAFVPLGFLLLALGIWRPGLVAPSGALHGWTAGAIALMTLAVMTRTSLGHTGRALTATRPIQLIYVAAIIAALARIVAAFGIARESMLHTSATAWVLAFVGFALVYGPLLLRPRA